MRVFRRAVPRTTAPPSPCADCQCSLGKLLSHFGRFPEVIQGNTSRTREWMLEGSFWYEACFAPPSLFSGQLCVFRPSCQSALADVRLTGAAGGARPSGCVQPQFNSTSSSVGKDLDSHYLLPLHWGDYGKLFKSSQLGVKLCKHQGHPHPLSCKLV